jgi:uroporphyrinogen-III synthase
MAGFTEVNEAGGDVARLMHALSSVLNLGMRILYLAGRVRRLELEHSLTVKCAVLSVIEVYDTVPVSYSTDNFLDLRADGGMAAVLLTSVNCAIQLSAMTADAGGCRSALRQCSFYRSRTQRRRAYGLPCCGAVTDLTK